MGMGSLGDVGPSGEHAVAVRGEEKEFSLLKFQSTRMHHAHAHKHKCTHPLLVGHVVGNDMRSFHVVILDVCGVFRCVRVRECVSQFETPRW